MTPSHLAKLHAAAMTLQTPWSEIDFTELLKAPETFLCPALSSFDKYAGGARGGKALSQPATPKAARLLKGFALGRVILDEAELLTLAVDPKHHRQGLGRHCLRSFETKAITKGAIQAFLDVATTNQAARALYLAEGWHETGKRPKYYRIPTGRTDAILMRKTLKSL